MRSLPAWNVDDHKRVTSLATGKDVKLDQRQLPCDDCCESNEVDVNDCDEQVAPTSDILHLPPLQGQQSRPEEAESNGLVEGLTASKDTPGEDATPNNDVGAGCSTPLRRRKIWNLDSTAMFNFARGGNSTPGSSPSGSVRPGPESDKRCLTAQRKPPPL